MCLWFVPSTSKKENPVPLKFVQIEAKVLDAIAKVEIIQQFVNSETSPIEAIYKFPVDPNSSIYAFTAIIDGKEIQGIIKEKEEARNKYDDAIASGHGAYLLEQEADDIFVCNVGNLPPGKEATIKISYVVELSIENSDLQFTIPTTVAPKQSSTYSHPSPSPSPSSTFLFLSSNYGIQSSVNYFMSFNIEIEMASEISSISCPSHPITINIGSNKAIVQLASNDRALDQDFVLKLKTKNPFSPRAWIERDDVYNAVMLAFNPKFENIEDFPLEMIFVVDQSGSMEGEKIQQAKNCLHLFLRSLPQTCIFNIVSFGSNYRTLFPMSSPYNNDTLAKATTYVNSITANMGGTEILQPLKAILEAAAYEKYPRQLMLLTDGEVSNTEEVIDYVKRKCNTTRVFSFGIGDSVSHYLIKGVARAGNGKSEMIKLTERLESKVMRQLNYAISPGLTNVSVDWGSLKVQQAPKKLKVLFNGSIYGLTKDFIKTPTEITLNAIAPFGPVSFKIDINSNLNIPNGYIIHKLAARALITELQDIKEVTKEIKKEITDIALKYSLASKYTSFVAIEKRSTSSDLQMQLREVPIAISKNIPATSTISFNFGSTIPTSAFSFGSAPTIPTNSFNFGSATTIPTNSFGFGSSPTTPTSVFDLAPAFAFGAPPPSAFNAFGGSSSSFGSTGSFSSQRVANAPSSTSIPIPSEQDKFVSVISLQNADGSWNLSNEFSSKLGTSVDLLNQFASNLPIPSNKLNFWATCIALAYLELYFSSYRDEWTLVASKAHKYLLKEQMGGTTEQWIKHAKQALQQLQIKK